MPSMSTVEPAIVNATPCSGMPTPSTIVEDEAEEVAALDEVPMVRSLLIIVK